MTKHNFVQACVALAVAVAFAPAVNAAPEKLTRRLVWPATATSAASTSPVLTRKFLARAATPASPSM